VSGAINAGLDRLAPTQDQPAPTPGDGRDVIALMCERIALATNAEGLRGALPARTVGALDALLAAHPEITAWTAQRAWLIGELAARRAKGIETYGTYLQPGLHSGPGVTARRDADDEWLDAGAYEMQAWMESAK